MALRMLAMLASRRYQDLVGSLDIVAMGNAGPMDWQHWSEQTWVEMLAWCREEAPPEPLPAPLVEYLERVRRQVN